MKIAGIVLHPTSHVKLDALLASPTHAVLLTGPRGTGKTHIAAAVAAQLLDTRPELLINQPYYRVLMPTDGSIAIEQIRELVGFFRLKVPGSAAIKRVAVLQDAETMGTEAQNALLKLLEEPPVDSVLLLTSSQPQRLLPTIRSRVQLLQLSFPESQALQKHFEVAGYDPASVAAALLRSSTNIAAAGEMVTSGSTVADTSISLVRRALGATSYERMLLVDGLAKHKEAAAEFVDTLATVALASLESAATKGASTVGRWKDVLQAAYIAQNAFERNGNPKLVLTELMLTL